MRWYDIVMISLSVVALVIGLKEIRRKPRVDCNALIMKEYESKSPEYKQHMSKLPFEVLYYYNYGKMEYCIHHGKLL